MKIIITENQNILLRRFFKIKNEVYNRMDASNPCYYKNYHDFDKYKRDVLKSAIDEVADEEGLEIEPRLWTNFRNELYYTLNDEMKVVYNNYIKEYCPEFKGIFESKEENKSELIYNMWMKEMSINDIKDYTGLSKQQIIFYLKDKEINIDCKFAENLVITLIRNTDFINKNYNINDGQMTLNLTCSGYDCAVDFEFHTKEYMLRGMATPYWGGECNTPVDGSYFENKKTDEYIDEYDNLGKHIENTPSSFKSIQELIDFLNNDYPKQLIEPIIEIIEYHS